MYISPSQIVETGYDQGYRFVTVPNQQFYKGFYHKDNEGRYWTGKEHTGSSVLLQDLQLSSPSGYNDTTAIKFDINNVSFTNKYGNANATTPLLKNDFIMPTNLDYGNGYFIRYLAQLKSSISPYIVELNGSNFKNYSRIQNMNDHYNFASMPWMLTGVIDDVYNDNIRIIAGVRDSNLRSIQSASKIIKELSTFLTDPLQYTRL